LAILVARAGVDLCVKVVKTVAENRRQQHERDSDSGALGALADDIIPKAVNANDDADYRATHVSCPIDHRHDAKNNKKQ